MPRTSRVIFFKDITLVRGLVVKPAGYPIHSLRDESLHSLTFDCTVNLESDMVPWNEVASAGSQTRSWAGFGVPENDEEENRKKKGSVRH